MLAPEFEVAVGRLADFAGPWWVCGGWAVDLHLRRTTRSHGDVDIMFDARDAPILHAAVDGILMKSAQTGETQKWDGSVILPGPQHLMLRGPDHEMELLPALIEGPEWVFPRGSHAIRRPISAMTLSAHEVPYVSPEVVLLYKSRQCLPKDDLDFAALLPVLTDEQGAWLARSVPAVDHPWSTRLQRFRQSV